MSLDMAALPHSNLNAFLFAAVGTEANGMALSVLSLLARLDLDPWQEAGRLADLSRTGSIEAMAGLIGSMPASPWPRAEAVPIATRLVGLLPRHVDAAAHPFPVHGGESASPSHDRPAGSGPGSGGGHRANQPAMARRACPADGLVRRPCGGRGPASDGRGGRCRRVPGGQGRGGAA